MDIRLDEHLSGFPGSHILGQELGQQQQTDTSQSGGGQTPNRFSPENHTEDRDGSIIPGRYVARTQR